MKRNTYYIDEKVEKEKVDVKLLRRLLLYVAPRKKRSGLFSSFCFPLPSPLWFPRCLSRRSWIR